MSDTPRTVNEETAKAFALRWGFSEGREIEIREALNTAEDRGQRAGVAEPRMGQASPQLDMYGRIVLPPVECTQVDSALVVCECCARRITQTETDYGVRYVVERTGGVKSEREDLSPNKEVHHGAAGEKPDPDAATADGSTGSRATSSSIQRAPVASPGPEAQAADAVATDHRSANPTDIEAMAAYACARVDEIDDLKRYAEAWLRSNERGTVRDRAEVAAELAELLVQLTANAVSLARKHAKSGLRMADAKTLSVKGISELLIGLDDEARSGDRLACDAAEMIRRLLIARPSK
jgi:hypothetical protein